jgi:hypothetical protein
MSRDASPLPGGDSPKNTNNLNADSSKRNHNNAMQSHSTERPETLQKYASMVMMRSTTTLKTPLISSPSGVQITIVKDTGDTPNNNNNYF